MTLSPVFNRSHIIAPVDAPNASTTTMIEMMARIVFLNTKREET